MKAITLWRPWDQAILYGDKRYENRPWALWKSMIGKPIALHAGKRYDQGGADWIRLYRSYDPPTPEDSPMGIVGIVVFDRVYNPMELAAFNDPWLEGPYGWHISKVYALPEPIPCSGKQGLWNLPPELSARLERFCDSRDRGW